VGIVDVGSTKHQTRKKCNFLGITSRDLKFFSGYQLVVWCKFLSKSSYYLRQEIKPLATCNVRGKSTLLLLNSFFSHITTTTKESRHVCIICFLIFAFIVLNALLLQSSCKMHFCVLMLNTSRQFKKKNSSFGTKKKPSTSKNDLKVGPNKVFVQLRPLGVKVMCSFQPSHSTSIALCGQSKHDMLLGRRRVASL